VQITLYDNRTCTGHASGSKLTRACQGQAAASETARKEWTRRRAFPAAEEDG
jgi:hypothetical protein